MPDFIVTQTAKEFSDYNKKKAKEKMEGGLLALFVFVIGMGSICGLIGYFR